MTIFADGSNTGSMPVAPRSARTLSGRLGPRLATQRCPLLPSEVSSRRCTNECDKLAAARQRGCFVEWTFPGAVSPDGAACFVVLLYRYHIDRPIRPALFGQ